MCGIYFYIHFLRTKGIIPNRILNNLSKIKHRGPDETHIRHFSSNTLNVDITTAFHRLAIMDTSHSAMQPFEHDGLFCLVNGEIWNHKEISSMLLNKSDETNNLWNPHSYSDCEVILPLFKFYDNDIIELCKHLEGEYAMIIYDSNKDLIYLATDELSVRPLFISINENGMGIASEAKALLDDRCKTTIFRMRGGLCCFWSLREILFDKHIFNFQFLEYFDWYKNMTISSDYDSTSTITFTLKLDSTSSYEQSRKRLSDLLIENVKRKLNSDREYAFLLSGGLDSSAVCALAIKELRKNDPSATIKTFTIGIVDSKDDIKNNVPEDIAAARVVAKHIGSEHHELIFTMKEAFEVIPEVVYYLETWDQTTIRASTPMYLGIKKIKELFPNIAIIYSGEVADELLAGYLYNHLSPSPKETRKDAIRLLKEIHKFDGLRADRMVAAHGCELRLPFFSKDLINFMLDTSPEYFDPSSNNNIEKYILRDALDRITMLDGSSLLPKSILWRTKEAFSDASSHKSSWKDYIKNEIKNTSPSEDAWYRYLFNQYYEGYMSLIPHKWMPPIEWCPTATDSSATTLNIHSDLTKYY